MNKPFIRFYKLVQLTISESFYIQWKDDNFFLSFE